MRLALAELERKGFRRSGFVLSQEHDTSCSLWRAAFLAHHPLGTKEALKLLLFGPIQNLTGETVARFWQEARLDVLIMQGAPSAEWRQALYHSSKGAFHYALLDVVADGCDCGVGGVQQNYEQWAGHAVELLAEQLKNGRRGVPAWPKLVLTDVRWVDGPALSESKTRSTLRGIKEPSSTLVKDHLEWDSPTPSPGRKTSSCGA